MTMTILHPLFLMSSASLISLISLISPFLPRGECLAWDSRLILLHGPTSLLTFLGLATIALTALYVYREGQLHHLANAYPRLWRLGIVFLVATGLSHLGNFIEIWIGGQLYWLTGVNKVVMASAALLFAGHFLRERENLVLVGRVLKRVAEERAREEITAEVRTAGEEEGAGGF